MKIIIGADDSGILLAKQLATTIKTNSEIIIIYHAGMDYPDTAKEVCEKVLASNQNKGILICGTGMGMALASNKIDGIRATLCHDLYSAGKSRSSNDANVLTMGALVIGFELAKMITETWLKTPFVQGNSSRKIEKIMKLEKRI